jgi:sulfate adenylyltransferase subunit 2
VHRNEKAIAAGANPYAGHAELLRPAQDAQPARRPRRGRLRRGLSAARAATKKNPAPRNASIPSAIRRPVGPQEPAPRAVEPLQLAPRKGESIRVFPLSNWTELDVWLYLYAEKIPIVPLYFAKEREVVVRGNSMILIPHDMACACFPARKRRP